MHPKVDCSTIYHSQDMEATEMSINRGTDKGDVVHIYYEILATKRKEMRVLHKLCKSRKKKG